MARPTLAHRLDLAPPPLAQTRPRLDTTRRKDHPIGIMPVRTLNRQHPAEKPGDLWSFLSEGMPKPTYTVLDPFVGAGGLLEWAKLRGHKAIGIEIEEQYCEIAARRLSQGVLVAS